MPRMYRAGRFGRQCDERHPTSRQCIERSRFNQSQIIAFSASQIVAFRVCFEESLTLEKWAVANRRKNWPYDLQDQDDE